MDIQGEVFETRTLILILSAVHLNIFPDVSGMNNRVICNVFLQEQEFTWNSKVILMNAVE